MAEIKLQADDTRIATIKFEDGAGANKDVTIPAAGGLLNVLTQGTAVTATGTAIDFTGIPSTAKRITVMFAGVSTDGTSPPQLQIGDSGGIETTGYLGSNGINVTGVVVANFTTGFGIGVNTNNWQAAIVVSGLFEISKLSGNTWCCRGGVGDSPGARIYATAGSKTLSDTLDRIRITTVNGTDQFDLGSINIMWE